MRAAVLLATMLAGCGGATAAGVRTLDEALATRDAMQARATAPELFALARQEDVQAHAALAHGDRAAAEDEATTGRLLLQAALAETRRAAANAATTTAREAARVARAEAAASESERTALEARATRLAAARAAEDELARALARARADEPRRGRMVSNDADAARDAARALARRARLLLAAATSLGATDAETTPATDALATATGSLQADPRAALAAADHARLLAEGALGAARARAGGAPDQAAVAELGEAARAGGLTAVATPRGVEVRSSPFRGQALDPHLVAELAALVTSHPGGPVRIEVESLADAASRRAAAQRATRLAAALATAGAARDRVQVSTDYTPATGTPAAILVFLGYAAPTLASPPTTMTAPPAATEPAADAATGTSD